MAAQQALDAIMTDSEPELTSTTVVETNDDNVIEMIDNNRPIENMQVEEVTISKPKRGPPVHPIWSYAFDDPTCYSIKSPNNAVCKHCNASVRHHHKTASVKAHLLKCPKFKRVMLDMPVNDRPDWWIEKRGTTKKSTGSTSSKSTSFVGSKSQSSVRSFTIPLFSASEQKRFNHEMAMFFYCTGSSFQRVEDPFLLRAVQLARPGAKLPTRKQLADDNPGGLLDECYQRVKEEVNKVLSTDDLFVCITSDAWSNVANDPVVNYMAVCPTKSLFLEAVHTEEQSHDAEWLFTDLSRVVDSLGDNVVGAVTDNTAANKKAWSELEKKYPTLFFHGCVSHGLHLLVKDIFGAKKKDAPDGGPAEYPAGYPFEDLLLFTLDCKDVVSFFHNHHVPKAKLKKALAAAKLSGLVQPVPTRWGTLNGCLKSLRKADNILNGLVSERDFVTKGNAKQREKRVAIKAVITDPDFVVKLDECITILAPIDKYIKIFQNDAVPSSDVYKAFVELEEEMRSLKNVDADKKAYLVELVHKRFDFMYGDAHGVAYLLDPRYLGDGMLRTLRNEIEDFIFKFPKKDGTTSEERMNQMAQEYTAFRIEALSERQQKTFCFKMIGKSKSVLQWWLADGTDWPLLQNLAVRVFSMAASSAASERNFSTFGFIHSKLRNRLGPEKVRKLVYIKTNTLQMSDVLLKDMYHEYDSDEEVIVED